MPIKPENKARYPKDWKQVRTRILERANHRCENCGLDNYALGGRLNSGIWVPALPLIGLPVTYPKPGEYAYCGDDQDRYRKKIVRIILTIAHLDHMPENCSDENLKAMCQRCHLRYDSAHHQLNAAATRRAKRKTLEVDL